MLNPLGFVTTVVILVNRQAGMLSAKDAPRLVMVTRFV